MAKTKAVKNISEKKATKAKSSKELVSVEAGNEKQKEVERQRLAIKRIMAHDNTKTCSCGCGFQWVPMGYKVKGMEELLDNINPKHESKILAEVKEYIEQCFEDKILIDREELTEIVLAGRGLSTKGLDEDMLNLSSDFDEDFSDFGSDYYDSNCNFDYDEFVA